MSFGIQGTIWVHVVQRVPGLEIASAMVAISVATLYAVALLQPAMRAAVQPAVRAPSLQMCDKPPTPGGWKDTMQRLKADFRQGKSQGESYVAERQRPKPTAAVALGAVSLPSSLGALALAMIQCEVAQFGVAFTLAWLTGAAPPGVSWPAGGPLSGWLSGRMTAAMGIAIASRAAFRPFRLLAEVALTKLALAQLRKLEPSVHRDELKEQLVKTAVVLMTVVVTVRAFDRMVLPGGTVSLLPATAREPLLEVGTTLTGHLTAAAAAARSSPLLQPLMYVLEFDGKVAAAAAAVFDAVASVWLAVTPSLLRLRVLIFK